ncbi:hypothetical protein F5Y04DRAFT_161362 [Hypomontagnella monticulosa]|nr:hypothetical protein F5Y04DRAFT_161362 [Hypomontagnella monticulosa]
MCNIANTRYWYIVTDQDLVACCFYKEAAGQRVKIMPIPWMLHGEEQLTTDLALWWLCMMALSTSQDHTLATGANVVGIGEREVRRHREHNIEQPAHPPAVNTADFILNDDFDSVTGLDLDNLLVLKAFPT